MPFDPSLAIPLPAYPRDLAAAPQIALQHRSIHRKLGLLRGRAHVPISLASSIARTFDCMPGKHIGTAAKSMIH